MAQRITQSPSKGKNLGPIPSRSTFDNPTNIE